MQQPRISVLAHNIRSLWNVGSFFRTGDAMHVEKIWLTGYTGTPPRREISKTAIGAEEWIAWEYREDPHEVIAKHKADGWQIVALEKTPDATDIRHYAVADRVLLIVGNEILGVPDEQLRACDAQIFIPMHGKKESLNVSVAAGIALHHLRNCGEH